MKKINKYKDPVYTLKVRDKEIKIAGSLSHSQIPKIAAGTAWEIFYAGVYRENVPGEYRSHLVYIPFREAVLLCLQVRRTRKNKQTFSLRKC
jgi:methylmalonyl-CoA mutase